MTFGIYFVSFFEAFCPQASILPGKWIFQTDIQTQSLCPAVKTRLTVFILTCHSLIYVFLIKLEDKSWLHTTIWYRDAYSAPSDLSSFMINFFRVLFVVVKYLLSWELLFLWLILLTSVWTDQMWAGTEFQSILHRQHIFLVCCKCLYRIKHTEDTYKVWIQHTTHCTANLVSLAYSAFYLAVKPLKSNSFTDFKPSSLCSPAGRSKLDYRIISNVITIATYATLVPFV